MVMVLSPRNDVLHAALAKAFKGACDLLGLGYGVRAILVTEDEDGRCVVQLLSCNRAANGQPLSLSADVTQGVASEGYVPATIEMMISRANLDMANVPVFTEGFYSDRDDSDERCVRLVSAHDLRPRRVRGRVICERYRPEH